MYSIKDLEKLSGIKAHTLRIWEQRYNVLTPHRTATNIRFYDDDHLRKLIQITALLEGGLKISKIVGLNDNEFEEKLREAYEDPTAEPDQVCENYIRQLLVSMIDFDEDSFSSHFDQAIEQFGVTNAFRNVVYPFLIKVGFMWGMNEIKPVHEHFASNLIRQKLIASIDRIHFESRPKKSFLLFLPENEHHELGLLMAHYIIKLRGHQVYYLGQDVPEADLRQVIDKVKPDHVLTFFTVFIQTKRIKNLIENLENTHLLYASREEVQDIGSKATHLATMEDLEAYI